MKKILLATAAMGMAMGLAPTIAPSQSTPTAQTQANMDKRDEEVKQIKPESGTKRSSIPRNFGRASGPAGRFLNQRQRRKLEGQTGRKRKR